MLSHSSSRCFTAQRSPCAGQRRSALAPLSSSRSTSGSRSSSSRRRGLDVRAILEPSVAEAVTQQATAFAIVLAAEAAFSRSNVPEADPGRPSIPQVGAGVGGTLAAAALVGNGGGLIPTIGLVVGLGVSGFMLYYNVKRATDLKYDDGDWPGPKVWPGGMGLISFFAVTVFLQALVADMSTKV